MAHGIGTSWLVHVLLDADSMNKSQHSQNMHCFFISRLLMYLRKNSEYVRADGKKCIWNYQHFYESIHLLQISETITKNMMHKHIILSNWLISIDLMVRYFTYALICLWQMMQHRFTVKVSAQYPFFLEKLWQL